VRNPKPIRPNLALLAVAACAGLLPPLSARGTASAEVVARVGATDVTQEEVRAYLETLAPKEKQAVGKDAGLLLQVVRSYLAQKAVLQEAKAKHWEQDPAVKAQLERLRDQALVELYLQSVSKPPEGYPSESEVRAAYDANPAAFAVPRQYRLAQVFLAAGPEEGEGAKVRARAEELGRKLKQKGADFGAVAKAQSDDKVSSARGGEIGWLTEEQMVPGIRAVVAGAAKDLVSEPIRLGDGWHLVKVLEVRPPSTRPFPDVRDAIAEELRSERAKATRHAYLTKLLERNPPAINELTLSRAVVKAE